MRKTLIAAALIAAFASTPASALSSGGYSLSVSNGFEDGAGYVRMRHGEVYQICLSSSRSDRADVELSVDGLQQGVYRLNPFSTFCLERPVADTGRFTFFKAETPEGRLVGSADVSLPERGRITAQFLPERQQRQVFTQKSAPGPMGGGAPEMSARMAPSASMANEGFAAPAPMAMPPAPQADISSGVTGLTGQSGQQFVDVADLDRDYAAAVTLELRLVHDMAMEPPPALPQPLPGRFDRMAPPPVRP